jgi:hypothetical protein
MKKTTNCKGTQEKGGEENRKGLWKGKKKRFSPSSIRDHKVFITMYTQSLYCVLHNK